jgi:hypothetical protein
LAQWILKTFLYPLPSRSRWVFALSSLWLFYGSFTGKPFSRPRFVLGDEVLSANLPKLQSIAQTHKNVVVASTFGAHFDVYMAVAWTLQRIMLKEPREPSSVRPNAISVQFPGSGGSVRAV